MDVRRLAVGKGWSGAGARNGPGARNTIVLPAKTARAMVIPWPERGQDTEVSKTCIGNPA